MKKTAPRAVPHWTKLCDWEVTYAAADMEAPAHRCDGGWACRWNGAEHPVRAGTTRCSTAATRAGRSCRGSAAAACSGAAGCPCAFRLPPGPPAPPPPGAPLPPAPPPFFPGMQPQPMAIPAGTPAGQNPTPFVGEPPFLPPSFNPTNGSIAGAAKPIYINFQRPIANRADGPGRRAHHVRAARSRQVLLDQRHPAAVAPAGLLAGRHQGLHRRRGHQVELHRPRAVGRDDRQRAHEM